MKFVPALIALTTFLTTAAKAQLIDDYTIDQIIGDDILFQDYFECIMGRRVCTPGGQQLKDDILEAVITGCADCPPERKELVIQLISYMIPFKGDQLDEFEAKYDPHQFLRDLVGNEVDDSNC